MLFTVIFASFLVMLVSLSGKLLAWRSAGPFIERNLHFLVSFAAGVMLVIAWNLSQELIEHAGSLQAGIPWIALGAIVVFIAFRYVPQFHHHHDKEGDIHSRIDVNRVLASDSVHNVGDGIVIVVAFGASTALGIASTISIMVHEMLQEISEFFVYREAGLPVRLALILNFISSSTILIGALGAYFFLERFEALEIPLLGLAVGSYLVIVFHDLIPHSLRKATERTHYLRHLVFFLAGIVLMGLFVAYLPHAEPEDTGESHEEVRMI